jgi:protein TonB
MTAVSISAVTPGLSAPTLESRPALALVAIVHVLGILALAHLIDAHRISLRPPLMVEVLKAPEPEVKKPLPKKEPPPKEKPPEPEPLPKLEEPPPPEKPDIPPQPLPQADMLPAQPVAPMPPAPQPAVLKPVVQALDLPPPPTAPPPEAVRERPLPPVPVAPAPVEVPRSVPERIMVVERDAPKVPPAPSAPRELPRRAIIQQPIRAVDAPLPADLPRMPDSLMKAERETPEAPAVHLAPREPRRNVNVQRPQAIATPGTPGPPPAIEPQPQVTLLPEPPPGATGGVSDEIALGTELLRANYLRNPKPLYPAISRRLNEQGTVFLRVFVTAAGQATQVTIKTSSGYPRLDHAAQQAVIDWKFAPARREGKAVSAWVIVPIKFSLGN